MGRFVCVGLVGVATATAAAFAAVPAAIFVCSVVVVIVDLFVQEIMALNWYVSLCVCARACDWVSECAFVCIWNICSFFFAFSSGIAQTPNTYSTSFKPAEVAFWHEMYDVKQVHFQLSQLFGV